MSLALGILSVLGALGALSFALLGPTVSRIDVSRRRPSGSARPSALTSLTNAMVEVVDRRLRSRGWAPFTAQELELAAVNMTPGYLVVLVSMISLISFMVLASLSGNILGAFVVALLVPLFAKLVLKHLAGKRRAAFANQVDETLQLLSAALRAGHGLTRAFDTVSRETEPPMSEELARVVNENRIGRDLVDAVTQTAVRMQNPDFRWVAEATGIQRETGGNLNEVLDRVGDTIRERAELRRDVRTLSAEGRMSALVLIALPFLTVSAMSVLNPAFMNPLYSTHAGHLAIGISAVLFAVGFLWMRVIVNVKV